MEVTKREVFFGIVIVSVMLAIGFIISGKIEQNLQDKFIEYETAARIDGDRDAFLYGMESNLGNAFVYGDLVAVDPVDGHGIDGQYAFVRKVKERYTEHTRTVTRKVGKRTVTEVQHYWTWDRVSSEEWHCSEITFLGVRFSYGTISFPDETYVETVRESGRIRYKYYVCFPQYTGTIYTSLRDGCVSKAALHAGMTIEETIKSCESNADLILFWIFWILFTGGVVACFVALENRWLEDERR